MFLPLFVGLSLFLNSVIADQCLCTCSSPGYHIEQITVEHCDECGFVCEQELPKVQAVFYTTHTEAGLQRSSVH